MLLIIIPVQCASKHGICYRVQNLSMGLFPHKLACSKSKRSEKQQVVRVQISKALLFGGQHSDRLPKASYQSIAPIDTHTEQIFNANQVQRKTRGRCICVHALLYDDV